MIQTWVFVTSNSNKWQEAQRILGYALERAELELPELQAETVAAVALAKAQAAYAQLKRPVIVEDAGLELHALGGFPGPFIKYWEKLGGLSSICRAADGLGDRRMRAVCALGICSEQGSEVVVGAVDMPKQFLEALRIRCTENGSLLIFDEVQCGVGRTGYPFAANMYGVTPDIITTAKALGAGFPVSAILVGEHIVPYLKLDSLGTTFGGGPMACAVVEAVIDIIQEDNLLQNVRERSKQIRETCVVGPVVDTQGAGLLLGLRCSRPAKDVQAELLDLDILTGTSADPNVLRILAPFVLGSEHVEQLREALLRLPK